MNNLSVYAEANRSTRQGIIRKYRSLVILFSVVVAIVGVVSYVVATRYAAAHVKFVSINGQMYYASDFSDYMSVKLGDISPAVLNSTEAFQFYLNDFVHYKLVYQESRVGSEVVHLAVENEVRDALEGNASKEDALRILQNTQTFNSFLGLSYEDSVIHSYMGDNFYSKVTVSADEIKREYEKTKGEFDNYPIRHMLGIVTDNTTLQQEILEELKEYDFEEVAHRYDEAYSNVFLQEGFLTPDSIPDHIANLGNLTLRQTYRYDHGGEHYIYQVLGVYTSRRKFIPLDILRGSIGNALYRQKVNSYIDDYIEILYSTSDIRYYMPQGAVVYSVINP